MQHYLDNSATTRVCPEAAQAALEAMTNIYGNPSSTHPGAGGQKAPGQEPEAGRRGPGLRGR